MDFISARQPFVTALLTLILFLILGFAGGQKMPYISDNKGCVVDASAQYDDVENRSSMGLVIRMPDEVINALQHCYPKTSHWISALLIVMTALCVGRIAMDMNLYGVSTCLGISLYTIFLCTFAGGVPTLDLLLVLLLLASMVRRYCRTYRNGYSFDELFHASLYLGGMAMIRLSTWPFLLLLPVACLFFRRTKRETLVACCGLLVVPLLVCYINWGLGGSFLTPMQVWWRVAFSGTPCALFSPENWGWMVLFGCMACLLLFTIASILLNLYAVGSKARLALLFLVGYLILSALVLCGPSATLSDAVMLAVPTAMLLPFLLVRVHPVLFISLYTILMTVGIVSVFI